MKKNFLIIIPLSILFIISIIFLPYTYKIKQIIWILLSIGGFFILNKLNLNKILKYAEAFYITSIILLILVLLLNNYTNGSRGWLNIGPISIQPSEIVKISLIILSAKYINRINLLQLFLLYLIPIILIFLEPDTGAVLILGLILLFFIKQILTNKQIKIIILIIFLIICIIIIVYITKPDIFIKILGPSMFYRLDRIKNFQNNSNIQTTNALISIASGNTLYFPEMYNDFFIAYVLSKSIYLIIPIIISTLSILFILIKKNTMISHIVFYIILWQSFWNIAMNLSLVPVIGIPYPFLSYGGTHIITSIILISLSFKRDDYNMVHNHNMMIDKSHMAD